MLCIGCLTYTASVCCNPPPLPTHASTRTCVRCGRQLDDLKWGYLEMTRFSKHQVWDRVLPSYLALRSSGKGDAIDARKHLAGIMQHRDPMRGAIPMLGLYFAYQLFDLQDVRLPASSCSSQRACASDPRVVFLRVRNCPI